LGTLNSHVGILACCPKADKKGLSHKYHEKDLTSINDLSKDEILAAEKSSN